MNILRSEVHEDGLDDSVFWIELMFEEAPEFIFACSVRRTKDGESWEKRPGALGRLAHSFGIRGSCPRCARPEIPTCESELSDAEFAQALHLAWLKLALRESAAKKEPKEGKKIPLRSPHKSK